MKNPFEAPNPREAYDAAAEAARSGEKKIDKLEHPLGPSTEQMGAGGMAHEMANAFLSLPNIPSIKFEELRVDRARNKMTKIYERSHEEAAALNDKYNRLIEDVASGKKTEEELRKFEADELEMGEGDKEIAA